MQVFYATVATAALAIPEAIRLLIQISLSTEGQTYIVYALVHVPIWVHPRDIYKHAGWQSQDRSLLGQTQLYTTRTTPKLFGKL
jgi:hypothetical protein